MFSYASPKRWKYVASRLKFVILRAKKKKHFDLERNRVKKRSCKLSDFLREPPEYLKLWNKQSPSFKCFLTRTTFS